MNKQHRRNGDNSRQTNLDYSYNNRPHLPQLSQGDSSFHSLVSPQPFIASRQTLPQFAHIDGSNPASAPLRNIPIKFESNSSELAASAANSNADLYKPPWTCSTAAGSIWQPIDPSTGYPIHVPPSPVAKVLPRTDIFQTCQTASSLELTPLNRQAHLVDDCAERDVAAKVNSNNSRIGCADSDDADVIPFADSFALDSPQDLPFLNSRDQKVVANVLEQAKNIGAFVDREQTCEHLAATNNDHCSPTVLQIDMATEVPAKVQLYDDAVLGVLINFIQLSSEIGGGLSVLAALVDEAFKVQRTFLLQAAAQLKPADEKLQQLLKPTAEKIATIQNFRESNRTSEYFNHLSAISESIPALGWVSVKPAPAPFIKEMSEAAQYYMNRILKDYKEKDKRHAEWTKAWNQTLVSLQQFVKQNHTTGLEWNTNPNCVAAGPCISSPPPPPPMGAMPPLPKFDNGLSSNEKSTEESRAALFADINKGLDITKSLKKVTADMQTHKNPDLRVGATVPSHVGAKGSSPPPPIAPKPPHLQNGSVSTTPKQKALSPEPVLRLDGNKKWIVENYKNNRNIAVNITDMKQVVYIYRCQDSVIQIKGKLNSITMDSCKKSSIVFDDVVSSVELINCQRAQIQALGRMPTIDIQKTDGCQVYLSLSSLDSEIITSKSSEMNILVPDSSGEFKEFAVPEVYKTTWNGKKLETVAQENL